MHEKDVGVLFERLRWLRWIRRIGEIPTIEADQFPAHTQQRPGAEIGNMVHQHPVAENRLGLLSADGHGFPGPPRARCQVLRVLPRKLLPVADGLEHIPGFRWEVVPPERISLAPQHVGGLALMELLRKWRSKHPAVQLQAGEGVGLPWECVSVPVEDFAQPQAATLPDHFRVAVVRARLMDRLRINREPHRGVLRRRGLGPHRRQPGGTVHLAGDAKGEPIVGEDGRRAMREDEGRLHPFALVLFLTREFRPAQGHDLIKTFEPEALRRLIAGAVIDLIGGIDPRGREPAARVAQEVRLPSFSIGILDQPLDRPHRGLRGRLFPSQQLAKRPLSLRRAWHFEFETDQAHPFVLPAQTEERGEPNAVWGRHGERIGYRHRSWGSAAASFGTLSIAAPHQSDPAST